jgi:hypothetical protein
MKRVEHAAQREDWHFRPCNYGPYGHISLRFREADDVDDLLRQVVGWMRSGDATNYRFKDEASKLFEAMFGLVDERILGFLGDWVDTATPPELESISAILSNGEPDFVFERRELVVRLLDKAECFGPDLFRDIKQELYMAAVSGVRSGVLGEPYPQDIEMKEKAEKALAELPRFSPAYELFEAIRKHAEREIARTLQQAELFEE